MSRYRLLGVVAASLLACSCGVSETHRVDVKGGDGNLVWLTSIDVAQKVAAEKRLPILVDFSGSDWCGWCIKLDKEVFSQAAFQKYAKDNLVLLLLDFPQSKPQSDAEKAANRALMEKYGVQGFPTVLLLDASGKELARTGYMRGGAEGYVGHLKELIGKKSEYERKGER